MTEQLKKKFVEYHRNNPHIYATFEKLALQIAAKREHYSARTIIHVMRWHTDISDGDEGFKISNDCTPYLSRLFEHMHPQYEGFFRKRPI